MPAGMSRGSDVGSPGRLSTRIMPSAPPSSARISFVTIAQPPRKTRAIVPRIEPRGSVVSSAFGCETPQSWRSTGRPSVPRTEPMSTTVWSRVSQPRNARTGSVVRNGMSRSAEGARASCTVTDGVKTCTLDEAPTVIASGAVPGEPMLPYP